MNVLKMMIKWMKNYKYLCEMIKFINVNYNIFLMWDIENRMDDKDCCEILILVNKKKFDEVV